MYAALSLKVVAVYFNFYGHRDLALSIVWAPVCPVLLQPTWILSWDEILAMIRGHRAHNPRGRKENKAPRLELTLYNVYITAHGVRVIRSECSNTESAHFQLNNEIALKRDRWVFVLCQVKVWVNRNIRPKVVTSIQILGQRKDIWRIRQRMTYSPFVSSCDHGYRDMWHHVSVVSPRLWQGQCLYWCSDHWQWRIASDIGVYWGYSLHIPQALLGTTHRSMVSMTPQHQGP